LNRYCPNETDYHQRVIQHITSFPNELKSRSELHAFVWGHEVDMHDAGRNEVDPDRETAGAVF
jgi:hypothetical protein